MEKDLLEQLKSIDPRVLTEVVRKDQNDPCLELQAWDVAPLRPGNVGLSDGGLFCFSGQWGGVNWSVLLKCIHLPPENISQQKEWTYLRREILALRSGMLDHLPSGLRAPRCYSVMDQGNNAWVWLEHVHESGGKQWTLERFKQTARRLGQFAGAYLSGMPLPDYPWMCRQPVTRSIWRKNGWWAEFLDPASTENAWMSPFVQRGLDQSTQTRVLRLLAEKDHILAVNDRLPQVLCHNDAHRRNFIWTQSEPGGEEELVAIDWAMVGLGAVGNDLGKIIQNSMLLLDFDPFEADQLDAAGFESYLAGIADTGVSIDPRMVRLGQLISLSYWVGAALPGWIANMLAPRSRNNLQTMYGRSAEDALACWVELEQHCLDRTDEARRLISELEM